MVTNSYSLKITITFMGLGLKLTQRGCGFLSILFDKWENKSLMCGILTSNEIYVGK